MSHKHGTADTAPVCRFRTKKECDENYADWQAMDQVKLAARVAADPARVKAYKRQKDVFSQTVMVLAGERDAVEGDAPFTKRIQRALETYRATGGSGS